VFNFAPTDGFSPPQAFPARKPKIPL